MKGSIKRPLNEMPFYDSMMKVQSATRLDHLRLMLWMIGFKAVPDACVCGKHEWNVFDLMLESVEGGHHTWEFYRNYSPAISAPQMFRIAKLDSGLTCPECGVRSGAILVDYNYSVQCCPSADPKTGLPVDSGARASTVGKSKRQPKKKSK
jgi:hypothetical protein